MTLLPSRSSERPTLIGDGKVVLEDLGSLSVQELAALQGSYSGPEIQYCTVLGRLFETLTSNVAPGEFDRVSLEDVSSAARTLATDHGAAGRGILVYAMLAWSAPQIHDACRTALRPLASRGDTFVQEAFAILAERAAEVRRGILAAEGEALFSGQRLKDEGHLVASTAGLQSLFERLRETMAGRALGALLELEKEGLITVLAAAQANPCARRLHREERAEQLRGMLAGSDFDGKPPERQDGLLRFYDGEQAAQESQRSVYDRSVAIFVLPRCLEISLPFVQKMAAGIAASAKIEVPFTASVVNPHTLALEAEALIGAWERRVGEAMQAQGDALTPATFLQWQEQVKAALGLTFEPIHANGRVSLPDLKNAQRAIFGELRLGELKPQLGGGNAFEPRVYVPELTTSGLGRITWEILQAHREKSQSGIFQKQIDSNTFHTWVTSLCKHLHVQLPLPLPRSVLCATEDLLERVLVVDGELQREVHKAFWDDEWLSAAQLWHGVESVRGDAFRQRFGEDGVFVGNARGEVEKPLTGATSVRVGTQVFLCTHQVKAERAAASLALKGRLPRFTPDAW